MGVDPSGGHPDMDYREHMRTYRGFLRGTQIVVAGLSILMVLMFLYLA
ncbi:MAG: aa3-type cytochrome c oxidase subunit IV [Hyphomicrobiaceae bacterium]